LKAALIVAVISSGVWVAGGATPAFALSGYQIVESTYNLPAGGFVDQIAQCPAGTVALGGGAAVVGAGSANFGTELQESTAGTNSFGSLWMAAVSNSSSTNRTLGIFAVCGDAPAGYQVVYHAVTLPAGGFIRQTAQCPAGTVALGGGASVAGIGDGDHNTEIQESDPGSNSAGALWLTSMSNHSGTAYTIDLTADCADAPSGYQIAETTYSLPAGGFVRDTSTCPAGKIALGGGAAVVGAGSANFGTEMQESDPGSTTNGALWLASVSNHSTSSYTLGVFAVCSS
jgi:hypothetical protein